MSAGVFDAGCYAAGAPLVRLAPLGKADETDAKVIGTGIVAVPEPPGMLMLVAQVGSWALLQR